MEGMNKECFGIVKSCRKCSEPNRELVVRGGWELQQLEVEAMMGSQKLLLS